MLFEHSGTKGAFSSLLRSAACKNRRRHRGFQNFQRVATKALSEFVLQRVFHWLFEGFRRVLGVLGQWGLSKCACKFLRFLFCPGLSAQCLRFPKALSSCEHTPGASEPHHAGNPSCLISLLQLSLGPVPLVVTVVCRATLADSYLLPCGLGFGALRLCCLGLCPQRLDRLDHLRCGAGEKGSNRNQITRDLHGFL